jgi:hypothetical protein
MESNLRSISNRSTLETNEELADKGSSWSTFAGFLEEMEICKAWLPRETLE